MTGAGWALLVVFCTITAGVLLVLADQALTDAGLRITMRGRALAVAVCIGAFCLGAFGPWTQVDRFYYGPSYGTEAHR